MSRYKMILQYEGTRYQGWQKQTSTQNTIQGKLEDILTRMVGYSVEVHGAGRTDAGVHALFQVADFQLKEPNIRAGEFIKEIEERDLPKAIASYINKYLPEDIRILSVEEVPERFHSRLNAKEKIYCYRIHNALVTDVFTRRYTYHFPQHLNIEAMREAARQLCGTHDYQSFCTKKKIKKSTVRTIYDIEIKKVGSEIQFLYRGNGFLYHMVRILTGTLLEVGTGKLNATDMQDIFEAKARAKAGELVPGCGLTLVEVRYS